MPSACQYSELFVINLYVTFFLYYNIDNMPEERKLTFIFFTAVQQVISRNNYGKYSNNECVAKYSYSIIMMHIIGVWKKIG